METKINYTIVGAFVIIVTTFMILSIIWLSSGFTIGQYKIFKVYMKESVAGLTVDSVVEFNGVNVGNVKKVEIDQHDPRLVIVLLNVKNITPITQGTYATLNTKGLTGVAYIALIDEGKKPQPLILTAGEDYPIINTSPSFFWRLDTGMRKLNENMSKVSKAIESLLDEENLQSIKEILIDVRHVTRALASHTQELSTILQNTAKASNHFPSLIQTSQEAAASLNTQILPAAQQAILNLELLTNNLSVISDEIKENPTVLIRGKTQQPLGPGEK